MRYYPATVVVDVPSDADLMREETFGPVAPVQVVSSFDGGAEPRGGVPLRARGDGADRSLEHATEAVRRLPVGTVKVNAVFGGAPGGRPSRAAPAGRASATALSCSTR